MLLVCLLPKSETLQVLAQRLHAVFVEGSFLAALGIISNVLANPVCASTNLIFH
jgi:hypothetical protein